MTDAARGRDRPRSETAQRRKARIAFLLYRGNPHCGGQGVYARHLTRELAGLGHEVTVFSGQPYPDLDERVALVRVASLDLYRDEDPFRSPRRRELASPVDVLELATMRLGGFGEPRTFSLRARAELQRRLDHFDVVHDDQCLGTGLLGIMKDGWPLITSIHHPVTIDRSLDLAHEKALLQRLSLRRWYGFAAMQGRVARALPRILTVSTSARDDIVSELGVASERIGVVPVGVDAETYRPRPELARIPGRIMTTASADVPLKGLLPLLEAVAKLRTEREDVHLVVVGRLRPESPASLRIADLGLTGAVSFVSGASDDELARRYAQSSCAVVPSLYEGFSLPAIEALASGTPLVATTGGALREVVGEDGVHALLVAPSDPDALKVALGRLLGDPGLGARLAEQGRRRALRRYSWAATARATSLEYEQLLEAHATKRTGQQRC